ncbi:uncharacterized protein LOC105665415 [Ceratitis capitata]|uniref:uncharacterized protein LOC105665415 n=1 Tax=Ceratitis capitata TaxID=7213 RepID=UPI00061890E5|nr:uncharacterized protein LOC105665415 [Ceratitis capitata]XP_012161774.1 uncharacterized protein LOC105665415 [Ceratitis capitata]XP_012161775.1 uncharacterized protein LOC105665415 [Ceratitis capitata]XP_020717369.1 uncharacterized protein LOC105665415 [Ceratitis capitata]
MSAGLSPINCDLRSYSRLWLGEFIELYQQEECLWHPKHPDYSNHSVRNKAYDRLVEKLKEVEPNPDRAMVVRKINSLRSAFRREFRKFNAKSNYETRLWYYDKLLFIAEQNPKRLVGLRDAKTQKRSLALHFDVEDSMEFQEEQSAEVEAVTPAESTNHNQPAEIKTVTVSSGECVIVKDEEQLQHQHQHPHHHQVSHQHEHPNELQQQQHNTEQHLQHTTTTTQPQHATEVKVLEITSLDTNSQREIQQAVSSLEQHQQQMLQQQHQHQQSQAVPPQITQLHQQVPTIQIAREHLQPLFGNSYTTTATHRQDDEYDAIGINVASKLRVMNPTQRIIAEKLISDVLFNGQLDNLSVNSTLAQ